jgi:hypothetical protein
VHLTGEQLSVRHIYWWLSGVRVSLLGLLAKIKVFKIEFLSTRRFLQEIVILHRVVLIIVIMPIVVNAPAIGSAFLEEDVMRRSIKVSAQFNRSSVNEAVNFLREMGIAAHDVEFIQPPKPGVDGVNIVLKNMEDVKRARQVPFHTFNSKRYFVTSLERQVVHIRVHWLPNYVNNNFVKMMLADYGNVLEIEDAVHLYGDNRTRVKTGVRIVKIEVSEIERIQIPYLINFEDGNQCLITGGGRPPLCLKCHKVGHIRVNCTESLSYAKVVERLPGTAPIHEEKSSVNRTPPPEEETQSESIRREDEPDDREGETHQDEEDEGEDAIEVDEAGMRGSKRPSDESDESQDSFVGLFPPNRPVKKPSRMAGGLAKPDSQGISLQNGFALLDGLADSPDQ